MKFPPEVMGMGNVLAPKMVSDPLDMLPALLPLLRPPPPLPRPPPPRPPPPPPFRRNIFRLGFLD